MPEGPSLVIASEELQPFAGKKVLAASGNSTLSFDWATGQQLVEVKSWGKHLLLCFKKRTIRIHFLLFGSYRVNSKKDADPRLSLRFGNGEINFYTCSVKILEGSPDDHYDWSKDVMNKKWNSSAARKELADHPAMQVADALLDQAIFAGVGNIIKNEVLFRIRVQPESLVGKLSPAKLKALVQQASTYSFDFLKWKKAGTLKQHWQAHRQKTCPRCDIPLARKITGKAKRQSYFCTNCQQLYR